MTDSLILAGGFGLALLLGGAGLFLLARGREQEHDVVEAELRMSPSARRRAARDVAISHGVRMAAMLSRIDGEVHATELDAIHEYITTHVKKADIPFAARIMRAGLDGQVEMGLDEIVDAILEVADDQQKALVVELMVFVACADGQIHPAEREFLHEIAPRFEVPIDDMEAQLATHLAERLARTTPEPAA